MNHPSTPIPLADYWQRVITVCFKKKFQTFERHYEWPYHKFEAYTLFPGTHPTTCETLDRSMSPKNGAGMRPATVCGLFTASQSLLHMKAHCTLADQLLPGASRKKCGGF